MKIYTELVSNTGDRIFKIKDGSSSITATMAKNAFSDTYSGLILSIWDDNFQWVKRNTWIFDLDASNIRYTLLENDFIEREPTQIELLITN